MWRWGRSARQSTDGSCTCSLRRIAPPRKPGKMPPYHAIMRGLCHDSIPVILPVSGLGTPVTVCHATLCLTQLMRDGTGNASQAHHAAASTLQGAQGVCRPYPQAPLRGLCTGSRAAPACSLPPPPRMVPTQGRPRHVGTSRHFCPHPPVPIGAGSGWAISVPMGIRAVVPGGSCIAWPARATSSQPMAHRCMASVSRRSVCV